MEERHEVAAVLRAMSFGVSVAFMSLVPRMKSHPSSHAHNGSLSSTPLIAATSGRGGPPAFFNMSPTFNLLPPKACVTGARVQSVLTILLWNSLSPGRTRIGNVAGRKTNGARAPCSNAGKAHMTSGGDRVWYLEPSRSADPCRGHTILPSGDALGNGNVIWLAHSPRSAHAWVQWTDNVAIAVAMGVHRRPELANWSTSGAGCEDRTYAWRLISKPLAILEAGTVASCGLCNRQLVTMMIMPALISALASEHKKTADLHAGFRLPRMALGILSTPSAWSWCVCVIRTNSSTSNRLVGTQSVSIKMMCLSGKRYTKASSTNVPAQVKWTLSNPLLASIGTWIAVVSSWNGPR